RGDRGTAAGPPRRRGRCGSHPRLGRILVPASEPQLLLDLLVEQVRRTVALALEGLRDEPLQLGRAGSETAFWPGVYRRGFGRQSLDEVGELATPLLVQIEP